MVSEAPRESPCCAKATWAVASTKTAPVIQIFTLLPSGCTPLDTAKTAFVAMSILYMKAGMLLRVLHRFTTSQWLPYPRAFVFGFLASPENLPRLMPEGQKARIE